MSKLQPLNGPIFYRFGVVCPLCRKVLRNEQGLAGHRFLKHRRKPHA
jgi:hypothetical protein